MQDSGVKSPVRQPKADSQQDLTRAEHARLAPTAGLLSRIASGKVTWNLFVWWRHELHYGGWNLRATTAVLVWPGKTGRWTNPPNGPCHWMKKGFRCSTIVAILYTSSPMELGGFDYDRLQWSYYLAVFFSAALTSTIKVRTTWFS